jgi:hypothetical protein
MLSFDPISKAMLCVVCRGPITDRPGIPEWKRKQPKKYCSSKCRILGSNGYYKVRGTKEHRIPTSTVGAMHELLVAIDLMQKGFNVFRALSPACPCDLAILDGSVLYRIEVTTAYKTLKSKNIWARHDPALYDVLALVFNDSTIEYQGLPEKKHNEEDQGAAQQGIPGEDQNDRDLLQQRRGDAEHHHGHSLPGLRRTDGRQVGGGNRSDHL